MAGIDLRAPSTSGTSLPANATGYLHNDGAGALAWSTPSGSALRYSTTVGDGTTKTFTITHSLGTLDVIPACREVAGTKQFQFPTFVSVDTNSITVTFAVAPTTNQFRVTVVA